MNNFLIHPATVSEMCTVDEMCIAENTYYTNLRQHSILHCGSRKTWQYVCDHNSGLLENTHACVHANGGHFEHTL